MITEEEKDSVLQGIWAGIITIFNLPVIVYDENKDTLHSGIDEGYVTGVSPSDIDIETVSSFKDNATLFSSSKTFQQVNDMSLMVFDEDGFVRPFSEFKKDADVVFETYNEQWLKTEFNTAVAQSQSASQWVDIVEDSEIFPLLKYQTADDERVRHEHSLWDNIVRPVEDPFWDTHMPQNGWNCRCTLIQLEAGESPLTSLNGIPRNKDKVFSHNPVKTQMIWQESGQGAHPYFVVDEQYEDLKDDNFGLPR